jgi:molybdopterin-containing oxidoreductase family iron-sulfur binding subunit
MASEDVETLVILGGNPVFDAPADLEFGKHLENVELRAHLSAQLNETSKLCQWHVPESHYLEAWGDIRAFDGTASVIQPLIEPLNRSKTASEVVASLLGESSISSYDLVRKHWQGAGVAADFERWWRQTVHDGVVEGSSFPEQQLSLNPEGVLGGWNNSSASDATGLELILRPDPSILDGRFGNNGWLQELPKPLTKLTWDNAALISPATAEKLNLANEQIVELGYQGATVRVPVWIQPGHPSDAVTLHFGYGGNREGRVAKGRGFNAYPLRLSNAVWGGPGLTVTPTSEQYPLACTQHHFSMEGRNLSREVNLAEFVTNPGIIHEMDHAWGEGAALFPAWEYKGYSWGMAVDLNSCIGCNACVVACQAENNIPVVGKQQVINGREMHWIRIDRYYKGSLDAPDTVHQPVMCQHCENAPCESVCPVAATSHSDEGLNDMVYNRCVGTRYCSNNCPYKVRRFNFLLFSDWQTDTLKLQRNPDVTVRSRGVMEKCTYCVQRINQAKIQSELEDRKVEDGEIVTACQQVCPADAIVFGDLNDPDSRVVQLKENDRNYTMLDQFNPRPRTSYLARLRNTNEEISEEEGQA